MHLCVEVRGQHQGCSCFKTAVSCLACVHQASWPTGFQGLSCLCLLSPHTASGITDVNAFESGFSWLLRTWVQILNRARVTHWAISPVHDGVVAFYCCLLRISRCFPNVPSTAWPSGKNSCGWGIEEQLEALRYNPLHPSLSVFTFAQGSSG